MSEETNESLGHDEPMDITEIESSHIESAHESHRTYGSMSSTEFEARLTEFFKQHQKSKLRLVPRIVKQFAGNEEQVLDHLHKRYVLGMPSTKGGGKKKGKKKIAAGGGHGGHDHPGPDAINELESAEVKPKSKKKLIIIIILAVVLVGGAVTVFLLKDKLFGGHGAEHGAAAGHEDAKAEHGAAEKPKEEAAPAIADSAATVPADTTQAAPAAGTTEPAAAEQGAGH